MLKKQLNEKITVILIATLVFTALFAASAIALADTTRPTILSVSLLNNEEDVSIYEKISVVFSEDMDPSTINANTFTVMQRTTPELGEYRSLAIEGTVTYKGRIATFTPNERLFPGQQYGNVFTVAITTGAKDLAGNPFSQNYVWSFTTGNSNFNTGNTTSQQNQTLAIISGSGITAPPSTQTPVVATPVTGQAAGIPTTTSKVSWGWFIGGLFLLLLIASIINFSVKSAESRKIIQTGRPNPFGDVHPVKDIEGIGPEYNKGLQAMGIKDTKQLWEADAVKVARGTGASVSSVKSWQNMAELSTIKDIGPQYAELLERSGVHTIDQLKSCKPNQLLKLVREKQDSLDVNIQGNFPGHALVENWIDEARGHIFSYSEGQTA